MDKETKEGLIKKLCLPIKVATIIFIIGNTIFLFKIPEIIQLAIECYNSYNIQPPLLLAKLNSITLIFQDNILHAGVACVVIVLVTIILNILWKNFAKKIVANSQLEELALKAKVSKFEKIATICISLILLIYFGIICLYPVKALTDVYMESFVFEAYDL